MAAPQQFSLRWNNYSQHIVTALDDLRADDELTDVTLSCDGQRLKAHKILLSACSSFFRDTFKENPCKHPIIIIKGVSFTDLEAVVTFMYNGQVNVSQDRLQTFLAAAELLQIKGLTDMNDKEEPAKKRSSHPTPTPSLNHNSSLTHSASRSGTPDNVQRPPSPKRKRAAVDSFSNDGASTSSGAFAGTTNNIASPATSLGGGSNGTGVSGLTSSVNLPPGVSGSTNHDSDDPFHPNVSIKYEDEQDEDEFDEKANMSSEDNDNSMHDMMCNVEPGSMGSFLGGSGATGLGTSGTDSSHGFPSAPPDNLAPKYGVSRFGLPILFYGGYAYVFRRLNSIGGNNIEIWDCSYEICRGSLIRSDSRVTIEHSQLPHPTVICRVASEAKFQEALNNARNTSSQSRSD